MSVAEILTEKIPLELDYGIAIDRDTVFINNDFKNSPKNFLEIVSFISFAKRVNSQLDVKWTSLSEITDLKEQIVSGQSLDNMLNMDNSDVEDYGIELFKIAFEKKVSDIHILYEIDKARIMFRIFGSVVHYKTVKPDFCLRLITVIFQTMGQASNASSFMAGSRLDAKISNPKYLCEGLRGIRVHSEPLDCRLGTGCKMVLRLLPYLRNDKPLEDLLIDSYYSSTAIEQINKMTMKPGMCIVSGPTGSGKSTLLVRVFYDMCLRFPDKVFVSIEDPPEYPIEGVQQIAITETSPDKKFDSYMDAVAGSLRSDPDVLMLGEIRYPEAANIAVEAVNTGHGLWATVHASSSFGVITRLEGLLAKYKTYTLDTLCNTDILSGIVYQRLIPKLCDHCKVKLLEHLRDKNIKPKRITKNVYNQLKILERSKFVNLDNIYVRGNGCSHCINGFGSQIVCVETILTDQIFLNFIKERETEKAYMYWKENLKGKTYIEHAIEHINAGIADPQTTVNRLKIDLI